MSKERRRGERRQIEFEVVYNAGREEGVGVLVDISNSGALLEHTSLQPKLGTEVQLNLLLDGDHGPVPLIGRVTRHTTTGFAIEITQWFKPEGLE